MIKTITYEQVKQYMSNNIKADIIEDTKDHQLMIYFKTKIADEIVYESIYLSQLLTIPIYDWKQYAIGSLINKFAGYTKYCIPTDKYMKLCERLNLPDSVKNQRDKFSIMYLTELDFAKCELDDNTQIYNSTQRLLSYTEIDNLCCTQKS